MSASSQPGLAGSSIIDLTATHPDDRPTVVGGPPPPVSTNLAPGQRLGHFELMETIGRGGMATVLKARDLELGRIVALKILPPETARDVEAVTRFKQEARSAARLDSDFVARVYFCGEDRGLHFIAFEFVAGDNLRVLMQRDGRLSPALAVRYLLHVAQGLKHAAERGVVHRDIKPSNILITPESQAKIVDMGLARHFGAEANDGVTQSGVTLGTFDYISPEQALDPRRADLRSDIYSLGCTFYHALTGVPPVPEGTAAKKLQAHQHEAPLDPRDLNPLVPEPLAAVLARMMAKDPARRYATAEALIDDLHAIAAACGCALELPDGVSIQAAPTLDTLRSLVPLNWLLAGSAAVIVLSLLLGQPSVPSGATVPPWGEATTPPRTPIIDAGVPATMAGARTIATLPQLLDALQADITVVKLKAGTTFDLTTIAEGITFTGTSVTLEAEAGVPPVLRLHAGASDDAPRSLSFRNCRSVTLRGLQFNVQDRQELHPLAEAPSALAFENVGRILVQGCQMQAGPQAEAAGLEIESNIPCEVTVQNSLFNLGSGSAAMGLAGSVRAELTECAFAPHAEAIRIAAGEAAPELHLLNCTFLLDQGSAIRSDAAARITAAFCLFASGETRPLLDAMPGETRPVGGVVLRIVGEPAPEASFQGRQTNGYYRIVPVMVNAKTYSLAQAPPATFTDSSARLLSRPPWAVADPRLLVGGSEPAAAFRLALDDPKLRLPPTTFAVILGAKVLGATDARIYPGPWPPMRAQTVKAAPRERVVWPDADAEDAAARLYPTFAAAYAALEPGETLKLAVNGPVPVPALAEKALKATIRAAEGFKPVLVAEGAVFTTDAALIRLADGELTFENLEIYLKDRQSIVAVSSNTICTFRRCILTLTEKDDAPAAAVVVPDPGREMRGLTGAADAPRISFINTILRGTGRAVWVQAARTFDVSFDNTACAFNGSVLRLEAPDKAMPNAGDPPRGKVHLKHSTFVLADAVIDVKAGRSLGGPPATVAVEADACLFAAIDPRASATPVVLLDDVEPMADLAKLMTWSGTGSVYAYSEDAATVEWRTANDAMASSWDWTQWLRFTADDGRHLAKLRFAKGSLRSKYAEAEAGDFALSAGTATRVGVDTGKLP